VDQVTEDLIIQVQSLALKVAALEKSLINIKGFYIEVQDGSQQGQIKYSPVPTPSDPEPAPAQSEEVV
jgi:hypothetical protein